MFLKLPTLLCMGFALDVAAHELDNVAAGLDLTVENLEGLTSFNGMPMNISRAVGPAVPILAQRLIKAWRRQSGQQGVRTEQCCGWNFASRISGSASWAIQWRVSGAASELLWSEAALASSARTAPMTVASELVDCKWTTPIRGQVAGRAFIQSSALCDMDAAAAIGMSLRRLTSIGWRIQRAGTRFIQAERGGVQAQVVATTAPSDRRSRNAAGSALVLVESSAVEAARR